jgi:putative transposase
VPQNRSKRSGAPKWEQLQARLLWPEQIAYEEIRPVVAFNQPVKERAEEVGVSAKSLSRKVQLFVQHGIPGLIPNDSRRSGDQRLLPQPLREHILQLKAEYPKFTSREIASICEVKFDRKVDHHTVERVLAWDQLPKLVGCHYARYYKFRDTEQRREAMLRLHLEGWTTKAIVGYLGVRRRTLYNFLKRWADDGVRGMGEKPRGPHLGARKATLPVVKKVKSLQEETAIGEFQMSAALKQQYGIELSPRTCGRIMAKNRDLYGITLPEKGPKPKREMPFAASRPHRYWSVDICYIEQHQVPDVVGPLYIITVLDNHSRAIISSAPSKKQDLWAYLLVLFTGIHVHGAPDAIVTDGGSVFKAKQAMEIYDALGITKEQIEARKPWQDYVESHFSVMKRMEAYKLEQATSWEKFCDVHARFIVDYNHQAHFAHLDREDGKRTPAEVLGWIHGRYVPIPTLSEIFELLYGKRTIDRSGYIRYQRWRLYSDEGLVGEQAAVWLMKETLTVTHVEQPIAQYVVDYKSDGRSFENMTELRAFPPHPTAQPRLFDEEIMSEVEWRKVIRLPDYARRKLAPSGPGPLQTRLFA